MSAKPPTSPTPGSRTRLALSALLPALLALDCHARVASETVYFLQPDGEHYLLERALRTAADSHRFYVDKQVTRDALRHVEPQDFTWDDSTHDDRNVLEFASGGFTLIFPGRLAPPHLERGSDGVHRFQSWDGRKHADGRYGMWYAPDDFDEFTYTWILPDNIELLSYESNRRGDWVRRGNAVSFYAHKVNNLTFELRYRVKPLETTAAAVPAAAATPAGCAETAEGTGAQARASCAENCEQHVDVSHADDAGPGPADRVVLDRHGSAQARASAGDADGDGVTDARDLCAGTAPGARVDAAGCSLDTDKDGVADGIDQCIASREGSAVDARGCVISGR